MQNFETRNTAPCSHLKYKTADLVEERHAVHGKSAGLTQLTNSKLQASELKLLLVLFLLSCRLC